MVGTIKPSPQTTVFDVTCGLLGKRRLARELDQQSMQWQQQWHWQLVQLKVKRTVDLAHDHGHQWWWTQVLT